MSSLAMNSLMQSFAKLNSGGFSATITKAPFIERTHFSGPSSSGGYHHNHHQSSNGNGKNSIALTALTLLSFLFFLNILQNCLQENMDMQTTQVIVMQPQTMAGRGAQKRKGEDELLNITVIKEQEQKSRIYPELQEKLEHNNKLMQIPIKLKTVEKFKKQI